MVFCFLFLVVSTGAVDCLERLVPEMTYYVSSGTLNSTHSLAHFTRLAHVGISVMFYIHYSFFDYEFKINLVNIYLTVGI